MKKLLLFLLMPAFLLGACHHDESQKSSASVDSIMAMHERHAADFTKFKKMYDECTGKIDPKLVKGYNKTYRDWVATGGAELVLNHLILDTKTLAGFMDETLGNVALTFVPVIINTDTTFLIGEVKSDASVVYSDIKCMFGSGINPVTKQPIFCPPPNCNLPNDAKDGAAARTTGAKP